MEKCKINFNGESKRLAEGIYPDLIQKGIECKDLDGGYAVANYAGIHCPDKTAKTCNKGSGDGVVEAEEVLEYAFNNYEKYREVLEGRLGDKLPWLLDDFDPNTEFDATIRNQVQNAISELKRIMAAKGLKEGTPQYEETLAVGLSWYVTFSRKEQAVHPTVMSLIQQRIKVDGLDEFLKYLINNGGLRVEGDYTEEYSALGALENKQGECTEMAKILFAVSKMANLKPIFVGIDILKEENTKDPVVRMFIDNFPKGQPMSHVSIGVYTQAGLRLLDPACLNSNADYVYYKPLSLRQYLSFDYSNRGASWNGKGRWNNAFFNFSRAIELDPKDSIAYGNRGATWSGKRSWNNAISDITKAIDINPDDAGLYYNRSTVWINMGNFDNAILDATKAIVIKPDHMDALFNRGSSWSEKGDFDKAIMDYTRVLEINPKFAGAYFWRSICFSAKNDFQGAIKDLVDVIPLMNIDFDNLVKQLDDGLTPILSVGKNKSAAVDFKNDTGLEIANFEARMQSCYAFWLSGRDFIAQLRFDSIESDITFSSKPSPSTKQFILKMLSAMPKAMRQNEYVRSSVTSIKKQLR